MNATQGGADLHPGVNLLPDANLHPGANCAHEHGFRQGLGKGAENNQQWRGCWKNCAGQYHGHLHSPVFANQCQGDKSPESLINSLAGWK